MNTFIGYSFDENIRYSSSSGGVGSAIIKYLFENKKIESALSFIYDNTDLRYKPKLIYKYNEYELIGSIYNEINLVQFIKENISYIKSPFLCYLLPCQYMPIKNILENNNIESYIVSLTCSSQQSKSATLYLLKCLKISEREVKKIIYRGKGWPGGITIYKEDGDEVFVNNNNSIWSIIFHSRLFIQKRCFYCNQTISKYADIVLADPWIRYFIENEKIGKSIILCNTDKGFSLINDASNNKYISISSFEYKDMLLSQKSTIDRKNKYKKNSILSIIMKNILTNDIYKRFVLSNIYLFYMHCVICKKIEALL